MIGELLLKVKNYFNGIWTVLESQTLQEDTHVKNHY